MIAASLKLAALLNGNISFFVEMFSNFKIAKSKLSFVEKKLQKSKISNLSIFKVVSQYMKISKMTYNAKFERVS